MLEELSATTLIKFTLMLLCFGFSFTLILLSNEIRKIKEAIAIMVAADPKLAAKINKLIKPMIEDIKEDE